MPLASRLAALGLLLASLAGCSGLPLRPGEIVPETTGGPAWVAGRFIHTRIDDPDGYSWKEGLLSAQGKRLLEPEWKSIWMRSPRCVLASRAEEAFTKFTFADGPEGPTVAKVEQTRARDILFDTWQEEDYARVVPQFALRPLPRFWALCTRPPGGREESYDIDVIDADGAPVRSLHVEGGFPSLGAFGKVLVLRAAATSTDRPEYRASIIDAEGRALGLGLPPLLALGYRAVPPGDPRFAYGWTYAFKLVPTATAEQDPVLWPLDPATGFPRADPTHTITGYRARPSLYPMIAQQRPQLFSWWEVDYRTPQGPRFGIETPGGHVSTGPAFRSLELIACPDPDHQAAIDDSEEYCLAERAEGGWTAFTVQRFQRDGVSCSQIVPFFGGTQPTPQQALAKCREAHDARIRELIAIREAERRREAQELKEWYANTTPLTFEAAKRHAFSLGGEDLVRFTLSQPEDRFSCEQYQEVLARTGGSTTPDERRQLETRYSKTRARREREQEEERRRWVEVEAARKQEVARIQERWAREDKERELAATPPRFDRYDGYSSKDEQNAKYSEALFKYTYGQQDWRPVEPKR